MRPDGIDLNAAASIRFDPGVRVTTRASPAGSPAAAVVLAVLVFVNTALLRIFHQWES